MAAVLLAGTYVFNPPNMKWCHALYRALVMRQTGGSRVRIVRQTGTRRVDFRPCNRGAREIVWMNFRNMQRLSPGTYFVVFRSWGIRRGGGQSAHTVFKRFRLS